MLLLSATTPKIPLCNPNPNNNNTLIFCPNIKIQNSCRGNAFAQRPTVLTNASSSVANGTSEENRCLQNPNPNPSHETLHHVSHTGLNEEGDLVPSASAVASAIRRASNSPVEFVQRIEKDGKNGLVLPSPDFQRLCLEQLDLFQRIIDPDAVLSVYVRPAGSYVMDRLELRRVTLYPGVNASDIVILIGNFSIPTGLRVAEASLLNQQAEIIPECRAVVFPMVKHPFVVGFLVAELPMMELEACGDDKRDAQDLPPCPPQDESHALPPCFDKKKWEIQTLKEDILPTYQKFTEEQRSNAVLISRSLAMAYVMDQKAMLLQQSSWQNNVRMSNLVEQIRGPLSSIRTLSKILSVHMKRSEISSDIVEDILVQGDRMSGTLHQLQDAVYFTKANIVRYNEETLKKMHSSTYVHPESVRSQLSNNFSRETYGDGIQKSGAPLSPSSASKDLEMPMPPLALAALQEHSIRPCNVSDVLSDLVDAVIPLARKQKRMVELSELSRSLQVAVEESALRQALSNLIEGALLRTHVGGKVEIVSTGAPAGGALVVIDDDGPDMHYMTQMHSLTPFGADLFSDNMIEDNMTWNFVAGLTVAREILESYGCVVRVISPHTPDAALGAGGTRVELWLPSLASSSDLSNPI
ncbi:hypothetical protein HHK36_025035 [Tetracentron sinense]|uniref:Histidine kinase/HSP90-like ATPase domain-containing protein n=1 Tax=Tetracentron sinense TaxID=13715 RepID=A0A835D4T7_TETSI|nr:hypothetical protein HHK36_025035 [Tetracentron sinense]